MEFLEGGVSVIIGSCDVTGQPECVRGVGVRVESDRACLTLFLPIATGARTLQNLDANPAVAVCFSRPIDHRTLQIKGRAVAVGVAPDDARPVVERYVIAFAEATHLVGLPRALSRRLTAWPAAEVRVEVERFFQQTPGPGAGGEIAP